MRGPLAGSDVKAAYAGRPGPLPPGEYAAVLARAKAGDPAARDYVVRRNFPLVLRLAGPYQGRGGVDVDDLLQEGALGLLDGADGFDPARGCGFSTYAVPHVLKRLRRAVREAAHAVRVPSHVYQLVPRWRAAAAALGTDDPAALAAALGVTRGAAEKAGLAWPLARPAPLDEARDAPDPRAPGGDVDRADEAGALRRLLGRIDPRLARVVSRYYGLDGEAETLAVIGRAEGLSRERVRQLADLGVRELRRARDGTPGRVTHGCACPGCPDPAGARRCRRVDLSRFGLRGPCCRRCYRLLSLWLKRGVPRKTFLARAATLAAVLRLDPSPFHPRPRKGVKTVIPTREARVSVVREGDRPLVSTSVGRNTHHSDREEAGERPDRAELRG